MGSLVIVDSYSHMFGEEVLLQKHKDHYDEVKEILLTTPVHRTKVSEEERRYGQLIFSGKDFNEPLKRALHDRGWWPRRVVYPGQTDYSFEVDFCKSKVGLEIQFGKYFACRRTFTICSISLA